MYYLILINFIKYNRFLYYFAIDINKTNVNFTFFRSIGPLINVKKL